MAKRVTGFLCSDGNFFQRKAMAEKHEAEMAIRHALSNHKPKPVDADKFLVLIEALAAPIRDYFNACAQEDKKFFNQIGQDHAAVGADQGDDDGREEDPETVVE